MSFSQDWFDSYVNDILLSWIKIGFHKSRLIFVLCHFCEYHGHASLSHGVNQHASLQTATGSWTSSLHSIS